MYQVNLGDQILYYPGSDEAAIYDTELNEEIGMAGEFTFKVPPQNPLYSQLATGALITILKDNKEFWRGEIRDIKTDFAKIASVYCLEDLAWLGDEYMTPASITDKSYAQRFQIAITGYNSGRAAERQFDIGYITNVTSSDNCNWTTEYDWSILDSLRNCICKDSGYLRVRRVTNGGTVTRYIDIVKLSDYGVQATQPIEYGYNLLDYVKESDYSNLTNVLTPLGDELDTQVYDEYNARLTGTTISEATSIAAYGRHAKAVIFDGVSDLTTLNNLAAAYLSRYSQPQLTMEVQAVDLADIESVDAIALGDSVRIIAAPFAVDQWLYLTQIKRDIQNLDKNSITLSGHVTTGRTLTEQTLGTADAVKNLPSKSSILDAAFKNVLSLLNGVDGGYVTFETDGSDHITEIRIANNMDYSQATQCWRWNMGGLAYLDRSGPDPAAWQVHVAMDMTGQVSADFITTGTLSCDRLNGGTITGQAISGGTITGTTITGGSISSPSPSGYTGSVSISGGKVAIVDGSSGYFTLQNADHTDCHLALGGYKFAAYNGNVYYGDYETIYIGKAAADAGGASDRRLKDDIQTLDKSLSRNIIKASRPVSFKYNDKSGMHNEHGTRYGLIAQELREVLDDNKVGDVELEYERFDGYRTIEYKELIAHLINCVQDLYEEINNLKGAENG